MTNSKSAFAQNNPLYLRGNEEGLGKTFRSSGNSANIHSENTAAATF